MTRFDLLAALVLCWPTLSLAADSPAEKATAAQLRSLDANVYPRDDESAKERSRMLSRDVRSRLQAASVRENRAWQQVKDRAGWEKFRDARLQALRASLGQFPVGPASRRSVPQVRVTRTLEGDGYRIENLVYETRPGLVATANLYSPAKPSRAMPGILIAHRRKRGRDSKLTIRGGLGHGITSSRTAGTRNRPHRESVHRPRPTLSLSMGLTRSEQETALRCGSFASAAHSRSFPSPRHRWNAVS